MKTVNIPVELFKEVKIICAKMDLKIKDFIISAIKREIEKYDINK